MSLPPSGVRYHSMFIYREEAKALLGSLHSDLLNALESHFEFLLALLEEDDWSFVIKLHALIETVTTQAIVTAVNDARVRSVVERLPLSGDEIGKLRIAKDLDLYSKSQRTFVRRLSRLRNEIVHDVSKLKFEFIPYVKNQQPTERTAWQDAVCWFAEGKKSSSTWREASLVKPKLAVWMSGLMLVGLTLISQHQISGQRKVDQAVSATSEKLLKELLSVGNRDS